MPATIPVTCPTCSAAFAVPASLAGKKIRCKTCQGVVAVPGGEAKPAKPAGETFQLKDEPKPAKKPKKAVAPAAPPPPPPHAGEQKPERWSAEDDEDPNPYGVTVEGDAPRCPFCAAELDPPDAVICTNCGYDTRKRLRNKQQVVWQPTFGDYLKHLSPAIGAAVVVITLITLNVICWVNMTDWLADSFLESDEKDEFDPQGRKKMLVKPWCFSLWITVISAAICWPLGKFAARRFVKEWRPPEQFIQR